MTSSITSTGSPCPLELRRLPRSPRAAGLVAPGLARPPAARREVRPLVTN
jgi:hypothetical protein